MSTEKYTPTTESVRERYVAACDSPIAGMNALYGQDFDRWLAAHDAEIRAERVAPDREAIVAVIDSTVSMPLSSRLVLADALLASGVLGVNADTIRAEAWDEGIAAVVQYDEGLMIAEMNRDAMIPDYPTNPYRKAAGA